VIAERTVEHGVQRLNGLFPAKANLRYRINPVLRIRINRINELGSGTIRPKRSPKQGYNKDSGNLRLLEHVYFFKNCHTKLGMGLIGFNEYRTDPKTWY
jgi:hypothetical protein